ncbi:putative rhamnogalacturonate lyase B [Senna tora]|uniref:Putative rhamnogalacturonate lyase B n=1 Tax=Senna tora TaxID=362788 RepID=A0A834TPL1_9FABA|nr:putative rhamnogalacturonate lyase B [Senna tora]
MNLNHLGFVSEPCPAIFDFESCFVFGIFVSGLSSDFYAISCHNATNIIKSTVESAVNKERLIKKVFGPAFYYFNSILNHHHSQTLWADVVQQTRTFKEEDSLMLVNSDAYVGLALPGKAGSGFLSDYKYNLSITVTPGGVIEMGSLIYFFAKLCIIIYELASFDQFEEIEWEAFISCCSVNEELYNGSQGQGLLHSSMGN